MHGNNRAVVDLCLCVYVYVCHVWDVTSFWQMVTDTLCGSSDIDHICEQTPEQAQPRGVWIGNTGTSHTQEKKSNVLRSLYILYTDSYLTAITFIVKPFVGGVIQLNGHFSLITHNKTIFTFTSLQTDPSNRKLLQ